MIRLYPWLFMVVVMLACKVLARWLAPGHPDIATVVAVILGIEGKRWLQRRLHRHTAMAAR